MCNMDIVRKRVLFKQNEAMNIDDELPESTDDDSINDAPIHVVNNDCLTKIFLYLSYAERVRLERVCKRWEAVSRASWRYQKSLNLDGDMWGVLPEVYKVQNIISLESVLIRCGEFVKNLKIGILPYCLTLDSVLSLISEFCPNLGNIEIYDKNLSSLGLFSLTMKCRNIKTLYIEALASTPCEKDLAQLFTVNTGLQRLNIGGCVYLTGRCLEYLPGEIIDSISMYRCYSLQSRFLNEALGKFGRLRILLLSDCRNVDDTSLKIIGGMVTITILRISDDFPKFSFDAMNHLANLVNLKELYVGNNCAVTDEFIMNIANNCENLAVLDLFNCNVTSKGIVSLTILKKLSHLIISYVKRVTDGAIGMFRTLRNLACSHCPCITGSGIIKLIKLAPNLTMLDVGTCLEIDEIIKTAIKYTKRRTNNIILTIYVDSDVIKRLIEKNIRVNELITPFLRVCHQNCH